MREIQTLSIRDLRFVARRTIGKGGEINKLDKKTLVKSVEEYFESSFITEDHLSQIGLVLDGEIIRKKDEEKPERVEPVPAPVEFDEYRDEQTRIEKAKSEDNLAKVIAESIADFMPKSKIDEEQLQKVMEEIEAIKGNLEKYRKVEIKTEFETVKLEDAVHESFEKALKIVGAGVPLMLSGPSGSGKTHTAKQIAKALNLSFAATSCSPDMTVSKLIGYMDATGNYVAGDMYNSYVNGGVYCLDELDASPAEVVVALNSAIENGSMTFPCGGVKAHKDFKVIACANTWGDGATSFYNARSAIDVSTLRRFGKVYWDYDRKLEEKLFSKAVCENLWSVRRKAEDIGARVVVSTGQGVRIERLIDSGFTMKEAFDLMVFEGLEKQTKETLERAMR